MGREPVDIHMDKKQNGVVVNSNGSSNDDDNNKVLHVSSKISEDSVETVEVKKECTEQNSVADDDDGHERQEVLGVKSTNLEGRNDKPGSQKSSDNKKLSSSPSLKSPRGDGNRTVPKPFTLATEKRAASMSRTAGADNNSSGNANSSSSPTASRGSQPNSPLTARKSVEYKKQHLDEEESCSVASSSATSVKTVKPKITVGVAPTFRSTQRLERRKEFYQKLEEKHRALESEKRDSDQRLKEEQDAAIKQLRRNMVYRANPVPSFYYEGPPPKVELKKLPLTRPKSPNLNRRKSCSDVVNTPCQDEKAKHCARHRHSVDGCKDEHKVTNSPRFKAQVNNNNSPRTPKINHKDHLRRATKGTPKSAPDKLTTAKPETEETQKKKNAGEITKPADAEDENGEISEETNAADTSVVAAA